MGFENTQDHVYGFQFHPESFLTNNGKILTKKILFLRDRVLLLAIERLPNYFN